MKLKIKFNSNDSQLLQREFFYLCLFFQFYSISVKGPIWLPKKIKKYTVLTSPHVHKKAREQFSLTQYSGFIWIEFTDLSILSFLQNYALNLQGMIISFQTIL